MTRENSRTARKRAEKRKQRQTKKGPLWKKILTAFVIIILLMILTGLSVFGYYVATAPKFDREKLEIAFASQFYDKDGEQFADIGEENRIKIEYEDLPQVLIDAVTATEDARFFEHKGIDFRRLGGAIIANIRDGFGSEGASTITHQVAEKMFLTPEKKIKIKVQEQWLAFHLEREFSKEQILEMYLNTIFYGNNAYGVAKAAEVYFGIEDLHDLNLVQAAILAGLPQRPSAYNPFENPDLMKKRVDTVLDLMVRHGKITKEEAEEAKKVDITTVLTDEKPEPFPYDSFIQKAQKELEEKLDGVDVNTAGLKVYTTLDRNIQDHVEFLLTDSEDNPIPYPDEDLLAGMAVVDTKTGAIRAIGGNRNKETAFGSNYAINAHRQPGSTIKPILAYGPAIEYEKWSTYHQILDEPYQPSGSNPIRNWNRKYHGWVSARYALVQSLNVPAAKTLEEIGSERVKTFAENLGIEFSTEVLDPRDAIGGTSNTVSPLQLAGAFAAFGNNGIYTEPYAVEKVEFPDGTVVDLKPKPEAVMADYTAYMVTDMLKDVVNEGTGQRVKIPGLPIAGKTGTTNAPNKPGANNSWFVGYTTNYSIGVWSGYQENDRILENTRIPQELFKNTMQEISKDIETPDFEKPNSVVEVEIEKGSNPPALPSEFTPKENIVTELFVKGTEPNKVSEKFDELDPVTNLTATYNEARESIDVSWEYNSETEANVSFEVAYKINDGQFKQLQTIKEMSVSISEIEPGATYTIQVTAVSGDLRSSPASATVTVPGEEKEQLPPVQGLNAIYNEANQTITASWQYNGPPAQFEVDINGHKQTVQAQNIQINNPAPGTTYTITVTPVSDDNRGSPQSTSVTVPANTEEETDPDENIEDEPEENEENGEEQTEQQQMNRNRQNESTENE